MNKKTLMYVAVGVLAVGYYMWWKKNQGMKLSDVKK
jgi:hypothetical protein